MMKYMDDPQNTKYSGGSIQESGSPGMAKEAEPMSSSELPFKELGRDIELPKEVVSAGVKVQPTTVAIPKPVSQMGVAQTGSVPVETGTTVTLPLSQPQIQEGLGRSVLDSWRWLAVWCVRRLKQLHLFQVKN